MRTVYSSGTGKLAHPPTPDDGMSQEKEGSNGEDLSMFIYVTVKFFVVTRIAPTVQNGHTLYQVFDSILSGIIVVGAIRQCAA